MFPEKPSDNASTGKDFEMLTILPDIGCKPGTQKQCGNWKLKSLKLEYPVYNLVPTATLSLR